MKDGKARKLAAGTRGALDATALNTGAVGHWDASSLSNLANGTSLRIVPDISGSGNHLTPANGFHTKQVDAAGYPAIRGDGTAQLFALNGNGLPVSTTISPPFTFMCVVRPSSTAGSRTALLVGSGSNPLSIGLSSSNGGIVFTDGNSLSGLRAGPPVMDDQKHIVFVVVDTGSVSTYIDGHLVAASTSGNFLATALQGPYISFNGDIHEMAFVARRMNQVDINAVTTRLAAKWGVTGTREAADGSSAYETSSTADTSTVRIWTPDRPSSTPVLVLWSHPQAQNEQIAPGYFAYPYVHAARAMGWHFAASSMGYAGSPGTSASSWGNATAQTALSQLNALMQGRQAITNVILMGASMGGLATALAVQLGTISNVKGAYFIDAALDLYSMYKSATYTGTIDSGYAITTGTLSASASAGATTISSSVSFPAGTILALDPQGTNPEIVTTSGSPTGSGPYTITLTAPLGFAHNSGVKVSDYGTKTAGRNPVNNSVSAFAGLPTRFLASATDTAVNKAANTDAFRALIAATAAESDVISHGGGHLVGGATNPSDFVAFVKRAVPGA